MYGRDVFDDAEEWTEVFRETAGDGNVDEITGAVNPLLSAFGA